MGKKTFLPQRVTRGMSRFETIIYVLIHDDYGVQIRMKVYYVFDV